MFAKLTDSIEIP